MGGTHEFGGAHPQPEVFAVFADDRALPRVQRLPESVQGAPVAGITGQVLAKDHQEHTQVCPIAGALAKAYSCAAVESNEASRT